ncbi:MAG: catalase [Gammaproteobacteria bacterium]|uniref:catalase n=1 Tax=Rhodoferax sp. TaxID=50421 RepID=UPI0017BCF9A0|nr:catalase [Rhodoferax sp.]MBU3899662.1 catalase [Gammaproteobacteria bacterium]MBA3056373.1 catalase [Rhodoferax sp.]MBU3997416.1 catalase [Gammaproteobacteria bacterium]MBU4018138.1 catalase [Gammaproteobacteria bacterium]MBU4080171.1 catalase [Gammaproteobacteria bacterium]
MKTTPKSKRTDNPQRDTPALAEQLAAAQALAAAMPYNTGKALEIGRDNAVSPPRGASVSSGSPTASASTLSETQASDKTGAAATPAGRSAFAGSLDTVRSDASGQILTTNQGVAIGDNQNSLKAGLRGPTLMEDFILREKITHFDHERIPERIVHARGSAAHGFFEAYQPLTEFTRAAPFQAAGKITPVFTRFSTVAGERGSTDTARDVRGFAVKFYTDEGNWDLVGNNIPVFFIQDAMKFPDLVHAVKPEPHNGMPQAASAHDTFWDFASLMPETTHTLMWVMSDRGIPRSLRMMQGFGVHTYRLVNAKGESHFVKFHWTPKLGTHSLVWDEAVKISGADSDFHRRDLWDAIEAGEYPEWELGLQIFTEAQAEAFSFDVLDATKLIPEELVPVTPVGRMVLNRNPDNFFAETEQVAFCTAHVVPGIDFSNDPLLAGRIHSYLDTQITRLGGANFHEIPINAPLAPVHNNQRDGLHRQAIPRGRVAYEPNSLGGGCPFQAGAAGFVSFPQRVDDGQGDKLRGKPEKFADHYTQATLFYESQTAVEQAHIVGGFRFELSKVTVPAIRERMLSSLVNVSPELAAAVAAGLGMAVPEAMPKAMTDQVHPEVTVSPALSLTALPGDGGVRSRSVAILVADGVDAKSLAVMTAALQAEGATAHLIAPRLGPVTGLNGDAFEATKTLENAPPVLFDGLVLPDGAAAVTLLGSHVEVMDFISNQYRHGKTILALGASKSLLDKVGVEVMMKNSEPDPGILTGESTKTAQAIKGFIAALGKHRHPQREASAVVQ